MSRIGRRFAVLRREGKKAFIPYVMAGHPDLAATRRMITLLEECGADIIELGVPFSDPLADGPTIQAAAQQALAGGVTLGSVIGFVGELRKSTKIPLILMTYYNPVFKYGEERFCRDAASAGVDGVIIPDLPPDEAGGMISSSRAHGIDTIFLLAPTSTPGRMKRVARSTRGFLYYVPITGITGSQLTLDESLASAISKIRTLTATPVAVGFGVSRPEEAAAVARAADGVIVGSAIVKRVNDPEDDLRSYLLSLRKAIA